MVEAQERCEARIRELLNENTSATLLDTWRYTIADKVFENKGYFAEHPLNKTYW